MSARLVVVSAGTYHLPFDRLSMWVQEWFADRTDVRLVVQHGPSLPVRGAENVEMLPYERLLALCAEADAVVLQGGAGGVMDMRALGVVPIVVPRIPGGGEVVDDHQLVFTAAMAELGILHRALTSEALAAMLDTALETGAERAERGGPTPGTAVVRAVLEHPIRPLPRVLRARRLGALAAALALSRLRRGGR